MSMFDSDFVVIGAILFLAAVVIGGVAWLTFVNLHMGSRLAGMVDKIIDEPTTRKTIGKAVKNVMEEILHDKQTQKNVIGFVHEVTVSILEGVKATADQKNKDLRREKKKLNGRISVSPFQRIEKTNSQDLIQSQSTPLPLVETVIVDESQIHGSMTSTSSSLLSRDRSKRATKRGPKVTISEKQSLDNISISSSDSLASSVESVKSEKREKVHVRKEARKLWKKTTQRPEQKSKQEQDQKVEFTEENEEIEEGEEEEEEDDDSEKVDVSSVDLFVDSMNSCGTLVWEPFTDILASGQIRDVILQIVQNVLQDPRLKDEVLTFIEVLMARPEMVALIGNSVTDVTKGLFTFRSAASKKKSTDDEKSREEGH